MTCDQRATMMNVYSFDIFFLLSLGAGNHSELWELSREAHRGHAGYLMPADHLSEERRVTWRTLVVGLSGDQRECAGRTHTATHLSSS